MGRALPGDLRWFLGILLALNVVCLGAEVVCRYVAALGLNRNPYIFPLLREHFPDFLWFRPRFDFFHSMQFFVVHRGNDFMYPAPVGVVYKLFYLAPHGGLGVFLGFIGACFVTAGALFARVLWRHQLGARSAVFFSSAALLLAFPVWFEIRQANMEIVIWVVVTGGVALFLAGRGYPAAVCFGLAASMKIYPLAYLGLFLVRRQYRQIVVGLGAAVVATVGSLWLLGGTVGPAWAKVNEGVQRFRYEYVLQKRVELPFDHSLLSVVKLAIQRFPTPERFAPVVTIYMTVALLAGTLMFFLRVRRLPTTNQILFLSIACAVLPPVSFEYTLLNLLMPLALLVLLSVDHARRGGTTNVPGVRPAFVCLAILLAPLSEIVVDGQRIDGQLKTVLLVVLLIVTLRYPFRLPPTEGITVS